MLYSTVSGTVCTMINTIRGMHVTRGFTSSVESKRTGVREPDRR